MLPRLCLVGSPPWIPREDVLYKQGAGCGAGCCVPGAEEQRMCPCRAGSGDSFQEQAASQLEAVDVLDVLGCTCSEFLLHSSSSRCSF